MNPEIFGWQHLTYLSIVFVLTIVSYVLILKYAKTEKSLNIILKIVAVLLLLSVVWNRISIAIKNNNALYFIPNSFCGLSSFLLSISVLIGKRDCKFFHFICYLAFIGGLVTLIYPDFIEQNESFFYSATISGLLHHTFLFYLSLLMSITKWYIPTIKKWYALPIGLCCTMTYGVFLITALGFNDAMIIKQPILYGTILTWWVMGIIVIIDSYIAMCVFDYFNVWRKKNNKQRKTKENE